MGIGSTAWRGANRRWVWVAAGIVVILVLAAGVVRALTAGADDKTKAAAATVAADKGAVTAEVATTGTLQPAQTRTLTFAVAGTVESVKVRAGSTVAAGDTLATIDDTDAQAAVDSAQDTLAEAQDALTEAQDAAATPTTAATGCVAPAAYRSPTPTVSPSPSPSKTATAAPSPTKTTPKPTRTTTAPAQTRTPTSGQTTGGGQTSGGQNTGGQNTGGQSTGGQNTNGQQGGGQTQNGTQGCSTQQGSGQQGSGSTSGQQGGGQSGGDAVLSAQQRVNQAEVSLENAEDDLDGTAIVAPIRGRVLSVSGKVGSQVSAGSTFISLADVYDMQVSADFPEADAGSLAVRQKAVVSLADRTGDGLDATVVQVDPVGTSDGTMVRYGVVLSFDDAPTDLLVGQSASVRVTTGSAQDVLRVPSTAVHNVAGTSGTVLKGGAEVKVGIGLRGDQYTEIKTGLAEGEAVTRSW